MDTSDSTTHFIYRIFCAVTGASYVGQTNNLSMRKSKHFKTLERGIHINCHLQNAYLKYGKDQFHFEVVEKDIPSESINAREVFWISHFDSFRNGYNRTPGGGDYGGVNRVSCLWNGVSYRSVSEAARANGIRTSLMQWRLSKGYQCDDDMPGTKGLLPVPRVWNGVHYPSIQAAADAIGISFRAMRSRLSRGLTCDAEMVGAGHTRKRETKNADNPPQ